MGKKIAHIGKNCVACGVCAKVCPKEAVKIVDGIKASVDITLCIGCGICAKNCPAGIIELIERSNYEEEILV